LGIRYLDRNLFGLGRPISFNAEIAQRLLRGEILYSDPWVFNTNFSARLRTYALNQNLFDYNKYELGIRGELSRKFGKHVEASLFGLTRYVIIYNTSIDPEVLGLPDYIANSIGTSITVDYRDSALNPSKGWVFNSSNDLASSAFGSSIDFFRSTVRLSYYHPIGKGLLALGARGGIIVPFGSSNPLPIDERFFNGGSRSVRSYQERSLGPRDTKGHAIGGETFTVFNAEYIHPITGSLKGAVFFDAGSVGRNIEDGLGVTGYAVGLGLRYDLPIGPIRVDYGFNPVQGRNQPLGALHVSFGFAF
jgi:outer membrane protein insertion porin family